VFLPVMLLALRCLCRAKSEDYIEVLYQFCSEIDNVVKVASAPVGTQGASLNIEWAYHNSPIAPTHKPYLLYIRKIQDLLKHT